MKSGEKKQYYEVFKISIVGKMKNTILKGTLELCF